MEEEKIALKVVCEKFKKNNTNIRGVFKTKTYLTVQEKISFIQNYYKTLEDIFKNGNYKYAEQLVSFTFFNLMVVKAYTNIDFEITFESMDLLQQDGLIGKIVEKIGEDYITLSEFIKPNL